LLDEVALRQYLHTLETVNSQLEQMGVERLYARTNMEFDLKVYASLIALACTNLKQQSWYAMIGPVSGW
jgi:hypothetical protein